MNHEFEFSLNTSYRWDNEDEYMFNVALAKKTINHLMDLLKWRKYLYLNQVYEHFGIKWNPNDENVLIRFYEGYLSKDTPLFYMDKDEAEECVRIMIDAYHEEKG